MQQVFIIIVINVTIIQKDSLGRWAEPVFAVLTESPVYPLVACEFGHASS